MKELMGLRRLYGTLWGLDDADTAIAYSQIKDLDELKDEIRVAAKYLAFDIEAARRENGYLKNRFDNEPYNPSKYSAGKVKSIATKEGISHFFQDQPELSWLAEVYDIFSSVGGTSPIRKHLSRGIKSPSDLVDMLILYAGYLHFDLDATETENLDLMAQAGNE